MCLVASGEVLVAFPTENELVRQLGYEVCESRGAQLLTNVFNHLISERSYPLGREIALIKVSPGTEAQQAQRLHQEFLQRAINLSERLQPASQRDLRSQLLGREPPFVVELNPVLSHASPSASPGGPSDFKIDHTTHTAALNLLNWPAGGSTAGPSVTVGVIDSGVALGSAPPNTTARLNVLEWEDPVRRGNVDDGYGHGTRITAVIESILPKASFAIARVIDNSGCTTSWHLMAAMACIANADVVNVSIASSIDPGTFPCRSMGTDAASLILESVMRDLQTRSNVIVVAAAGNESRPELALPARYRDALAVVAINTSGRLSGFSNHGVVDHTQGPHPNVFAAPGGDTVKTRWGGRRTTEKVGATAKGDKPYYGTSYAAAYATGVVAAHIAANPGITSSKTLSDLRTQADKDPSWYVPQQHGNGVIRLL
jgi:subtilisin family serine protease